MAKMTSADLKGDTARGAAYISKRQAEVSHTRLRPETHSDALADMGIVPSWDVYPELVDMLFGDLVQRRADLKEAIDLRQSQLKDLDLEIQAAMTVAGTEKVKWENRPVSIVHSRSGSKIVAEKLLMAGVAAQTIADATEPGKPYDYLLVGKPGK